MRNIERCCDPGVGGKNDLPEDLQTPVRYFADQQL